MFPSLPSTLNAQRRMLKNDNYRFAARIQTESTSMRVHRDVLKRWNVVRTHECADHVSVDIPCKTFGKSKEQDQNNKSAFVVVVRLGTWDD